MHLRADGAVWEIDPRRLTQPPLRTTAAPRSAVFLGAETSSGNILGITASGDLYEIPAVNDWSVWNLVVSLP